MNIADITQISSGRDLETQGSEFTITFTSKAVRDKYVMIRARKTNDGTSYTELWACNYTTPTDTTLAYVIPGGASGFIWILAPRSIVPNGVAVISDNCQFVVSTKQSSSEYWGEEGIPIEGATQTTNHATARADYNGETNTVAIRKILGPGTVYNFPLTV